MPPKSTPTVPRKHAPGGFIFWLLLLLGFSTFAPSILLPEWRAYQAICVAEQIEQQRADAMAALVLQKRQALGRLQSDPAVTARLAQRNLRWERVDHFRLAVAPELAEERIAPFDALDVLPAVEPAGPIVVEPVNPPDWLMRWLRLLPPYDYDRVFCDEEIRPIIMTMSVALIGLAFVLYGRRTTTPVA